MSAHDKSPHVGIGCFHAFLNFFYRSFMFELKQQVLSGRICDAVDTQTCVARLLGALQGLLAPILNSSIVGAVFN